MEEHKENMPPVLLDHLLEPYDANDSSSYYLPTGWGGPDGSEWKRSREEAAGNDPNPAKKTKKDS